VWNSYSRYSIAVEYRARCVPANNPTPAFYLHMGSAQRAWIFVCGEAFSVYSAIAFTCCSTVQHGKLGTMLWHSDHCGSAHSMAQDNSCQRSHQSYVTMLCLEGCAVSQMLVCVTQDVLSPAGTRLQGAPSMLHAQYTCNVNTLCTLCATPSPTQPNHHASCSPTGLHYTCPVCWPC
jgi:hypothetical protein